jgi:hypothetical protein
MQRVVDISACLATLAPPLTTTAAEQVGDTHHSSPLLIPMLLPDNIHLHGDRLALSSHVVKPTPHLHHLALSPFALHPEHEVAIEHLAHLEETALQLRAVGLHHFLLPRPFRFARDVGLLCDSVLEGREGLFERFAADLV